MQQEVGDFALFLREKQLSQEAEKPLLEWRGALRHLRDEYTSVELQHKALEWRMESFSEEQMNYSEVTL